jgi:hypothetical protein
VGGRENRPATKGGGGAGSGETEGERTIESRLIGDAFSDPPQQKRDAIPKLPLLALELLDVVAVGVEDARDRERPDGACKRNHG